MLKRLAIIAIAAIMAVCVSGQPNKTAGQKQQAAKQVACFRSSVFGTV
jgi:hypothetical protein